jgi:hypothetical protein
MMATMRVLVALTAGITLFAGTCAVAGPFEGVDWAAVVRHDPQLTHVTGRPGVVAAPGEAQGTPGPPSIGRVDGVWVAIIPLLSGSARRSSVSLVYTQDRVHTYAAAFFNPDGQDKLYVDGGRLVEYAAYYRTGEARCCPSHVRTWYAYSDHRFVRMRSLIVDSVRPKFQIPGREIGDFVNVEEPPGWFRASLDRLFFPHQALPLWFEGAHGVLSFRPGDVAGRNLDRADLLTILPAGPYRKSVALVDQGSSLPNLQPTVTVYDPVHRIIAWTAGFHGSYDNALAFTDIQPPEAVAARDLSTARTQSGIHLGQRAADVMRIHPRPHIVRRDDRSFVYYYVSPKPCTSILDVFIHDQRVRAIRESHTCGFGS